MALDKSLFLTLAGYTPRPGRYATEDFLTELFAWILNNIEGYASSLLSLFHDVNKTVPEYKAIQAHAETQKVINGGRIDLFLAIDGDVAFIFEHKVNSWLSDGQLDKYMKKSELLEEILYSVLIVKHKKQWTQKADVQLTWTDIFKLTRRIRGRYKDDERFVLDSFLHFLEGNDMGEKHAITQRVLAAVPEVLTGYQSLEYIFKELETFPWKEKFEALDSLPLKIKEMIKKASPEFHKERWGRIGIDFFNTWDPGLFVGVIWNPKDHKIYPRLKENGPDFVVMLDYDHKDLKTYNSFKKSLEFKMLCEKLVSNHEGFDDFLYTSRDLPNPWRVAVLRIPLWEVIRESKDIDSQIDLIFQRSIVGIRMIVESLIPDALSENVN